MLTILFFQFCIFRCSNPDQQSHLHINLVATLAMAQIIFLTGINATHNQVISSVRVRCCFPCFSNLKLVLLINTLILNLQF